MQTRSAVFPGLLRTLGAYTTTVQAASLGNEQRCPFRQRAGWDTTRPGPRRLSFACPACSLGQWIDSTKARLSLAQVSRRRLNPLLRTRWPAQRSVARWRDLLLRRAIFAGIEVIPACPHGIFRPRRSPEADPLLKSCREMCPGHQPRAGERCRASPSAANTRPAPYLA